jgi:L-iditol 2-dehydrogenase
LASHVIGDADGDDWAMNRVARLHGTRDLRLGVEPVPSAGPNELLLEIGAVGLCGSDRHQYLEGGIGGEAIERPLVLGHEVGGVVAAGDRTGHRVAIDPAIPCGACDTCRAGRLHLCPEMRFAGLGQTDGGLQRYLAWPADRCVRVPDSIADHEVPMLEVLGIALHAMDLGGVAAGMRAGVFGCGPVGLIVIRALRAAGVEVVIATDRLARRLDAAEASGAAATALVGENGGSASLPAVDIAFECAGEPGSTDDALRALVPGGLVLLVGIPEGARASHVAGPARRKELGLKWVRRMADGDLARATEAVGAGRISFAGLVTARYDLDEAGLAFEALAARSELKIVVTPSSGRAG